MDSGAKPKNPARDAAVTALAVVGFVVLIIIGITLAIYSARYVPMAVNEIGSSTAKLVTKDDATYPSLSVVSSSTSPSYYTIVPPTQPVETYTPPATKPVPTYTQPVSHAPYGLPNLRTTILAVGYLTTPSSDSFVASPVIPIGARAAIKFSIANTGTNVTGPWNFAAFIPTHHGYVFTSPTEPSMGPGDHTVFTLAFDQADWGSNQPMTILADPANYLYESNEGDNNGVGVITVIGS